MLIVDGSMLAHRCYAKMDFLKNTRGEPTGMEFGFLRTVESLQKKFPDHVVTIAFDSPRATAHTRRLVNPKYKANRTPRDESFYERLTNLKTVVVQAYPWSEERYREADYVMYGLQRNQIDVLLYTNDNDLLQAVDDSRRVRVLKSFKSKLFKWNETKVRQRYGVSPSRLAFLRAYLGDASDNVPGIGWIRQKYLASLIEWAHECGLDDRATRAEIETAEGWTSREREMIRAWHQHAWHVNYKLMNLNVASSVLPREPRRCREIVVAAIKKWEITSLELCNAYRVELVNNLKNAEF